MVLTVRVEGYLPYPIDTLIYFFRSVLCVSIGIGLEMMVRCCLATLHRLGHPGKQGNCDTWDGVPSPNPIREGVGKHRRLRHIGEIAHQTRQSTGTGLTISHLARPMCDIILTYQMLRLN